MKASANGKLVYGSRPIKRTRRTKADIRRLRFLLYATLHEHHPMTVRQVFYQMVSQGYIDKTEQEYKNAVGRQLVDMRVVGEIPFDWIADNTRWMRKPRTYSSMEQALYQTAQTYRRALWDTQSVYVEVWTEKDALAGVLMEETEPWDVPLMVAKGFSSVSYLYEAAESIKAQAKPAYLYYFGDHDPSGVHIDRAIERRLREFAPGAEICFRRVAVTPDQIALWDLPTRPTKRSDSRSKNFDGDSVEVDAIPPDHLQRLVRECIQQHVDDEQLAVVRVAELSERQVLDKLTKRLTHLR
jgi:hypothetical protein